MQFGQQNDLYGRVFATIFCINVTFSRKYDKM